MFTIYHALIVAIAFIAGAALSYSIGKADGEAEAYRKVEDYYRAKRRVNK